MSDFFAHLLGITADVLLIRAGGKKRPSLLGWLLFGLIFGGALFLLTLL